MVLNKKVLGYIVSLSMLSTVRMPASAASVQSACQGAVDEFLVLPTDQTLARLATLDQAGCWPVLRSSNSTVDKLNHWVQRGNPWAALYLAKYLNQLDGGNLEDAFIALGRFSEHDMESLLLLAKNGLLTKHKLTSALTMLPLALSDNPRAQLNSLALRRSKVKRVTRRDLAHQRAQALGAIDEFVAEIKSKNPPDDR
jgi:hypothetical protein